MTATEHRPRLWLRRVRVRVTFAAVVVSLLAAVIGSVVFVSSLHGNLEKALLSSARQQAGTVAAQLRTGRPASEAAVTGMRDIIVQIVDADGRLLASDHPSAATPLRTSPGVTESVHIRSLDETYAVYATGVSGGLLVVVGLSEEQVIRATGIAIALLAIAVPVGVVLIGAVVSLSIGRALRPIEVMRREAAMMTTARLHERLAVPPGDDEVPLLASTLNEMLDRVDQSQRLQRQFVSDASHELRSPLANVRQLLEVARRHPERTTVRQLTDEIWGEEVRMEGLVKSLLQLASLDDQATERAQVVDLDDLVIQEIDRLRANGSGVVFDRGLVSAGQAYGDAVLFGQMVKNLLSNAARHASSRVRVTLDEIGDTVVLAVEDDGHGIPEADRARVFERFARLDEARAREVGGTGLGLAIVQKVVESAHGSVAVDDSELGGARFVVVLPAAATDPQA